MSSKSINLSDIVAKLNIFKDKALRYLPIIFVVLLIGMYSFLVFRIKSLVGSEPSDEAVAEKLQAVQRPKIDQSAIDKLQQLQDNSSDVQTLFKEARDNPFQE